MCCCTLQCGGSGSCCCTSCFQWIAHVSTFRSALPPREQPVRLPLQLLCSIGISNTIRICSSINNKPIPEITISLFLPTLLVGGVQNMTLIYLDEDSNYYGGYRTQNKNNICSSSSCCSSISSSSRISCSSVS